MHFCTDKALFFPEQLVFRVLKEIQVTSYFKLAIIILFKHRHANNANKRIKMKIIGYNFIRI